MTTPTLTDFIEARHGTRRWIVGGRCPRYVARGYDLFLSRKAYSDLQVEYERLYRVEAAMLAAGYLRRYGFPLEVARHD